MLKPWYNLPAWRGNNANPNFHNTIWLIWCILTDVLGTSDDLRGAIVEVLSNAIFFAQIRNALLVQALVAFQHALGCTSRERIIGAWIIENNCSSNCWAQYIYIVICQFSLKFLLTYQCQKPTMRRLMWVQSFSCCDPSLPRLGVKF